MDEDKNIRLHYAGEFRRTRYMGGKSFLVRSVDMDCFSYAVLMEFVKDYLHYTEIGGAYVCEKKGGWKLLVDDKGVNEYVGGCKNEEIDFYIDNTVDKTIAPIIQMQPHVIVRPRNNIIQDSSKKLTKRKYITAHGLQQQHKKVRQELTKYEQDRILRMQENAAVSKSLGVPSLVSSMTQAMMNTSQNRNAKGKDSEVDEYIPDNDGEDDSDDSSERNIAVNSKQSLPGPRTRSRANAVLEIEKEATSPKKAISTKGLRTRTPTPKKSNRAKTEETMMKLTSPNRAIAEGTTRKLFSTPTTSHAPVLMPTCSKVFKQSSNSEAAGSVAAYLAMRERQKQNVAAPRMENGTDQLDGQEGIAEEVDAVSKVQGPKKPRGKSKMIKVHARGPDEKEVVTLNEDGQPISDNITELSNFLGTLAKDNVSLTYINWHVVPDQLKRQMLEYALARYVIPDEGHKWVVNTLNESWRQYKCRIKARYYKKYPTDEQRLANRPNTIPLEDFRMLLKYWGDEAVQALAETNSAHRKTLTETHTMGPKTHAVAKEKIRKKDPDQANPPASLIYLETYKREPGRKYKTNTDELKAKYAKIEAMVDAGNIAEADAIVSAGRKRQWRNWLVGRRGKMPEKNPAHTDSYAQELTAKIRQELEADLDARVNRKVKETVSWLLKKLVAANPDLNLDVVDFGGTSDEDDE